MANAIQAQKLLDASETGSMDLLREMKKIKGDKKTVESLPDMPAGATGEDMIVEEFRKKKQYNFLDTRSEMDTLGEKIKNMISGTCMGGVNLFL